MMLRSAQIKVAKEEFYDAKNQIDNIVISKLVWIKKNSKYLIGYLEDLIRPLVSLLP